MTRDQKDRLKDLGKDVAADAAKHAVKALGDKMAKAKRPFWRKLVAFFRGGR